MCVKFPLYFTAPECQKIPFRSRAEFMTFFSRRSGYNVINGDQEAAKAFKDDPLS